MADRTDYTLLDKLWPKRNFRQWEHRNPDGDYHYNRQRRLPGTTGAKKVNLVVLHTSEQKPDFKPPDDGAEWLVSYQLNTKRNASWHCSVDSEPGGEGEGIIFSLPESSRAWHVKHSYSMASVGIEMATEAHMWKTSPKDWVTAMLTNAAHVVGYWCVGLDIPPELISKDKVDKGEAGVTYHGWLDRGRRSDPGIYGDFPDAQFFQLLHKSVDLWTNDPEQARVKGTPVAKPKPVKSITQPKHTQPKVTVSSTSVLCDFLDRYGYRAVRGDRAHIRRVQALVSTKADGLYGPNTRRAVAAWVKKHRGR